MFHWWMLFGAIVLAILAVIVCWPKPNFCKSAAERSRHNRAAMEFSALPPAPAGMRWCFGVDGEWTVVPIEAPISAPEGVRPASPKTGSGVRRARLSLDPKPMRDLRRELKKRLGDTPKRKRKSKISKKNKKR